MILTSPQEPEEIKRLLGSLCMPSPLPETLGCDFLFGSLFGRVGIQRKTVTDLFASIIDGRLSKELMLMRQVDMPILMLEGWPKFDYRGLIANLPYMDMHSREQVRNTLRSIHWIHGVAIERTDDMADTVEALSELAKWTNKEGHTSFFTRPKTAAWPGKPSAKEVACWILQGFTGIGPKLAGAIYDHFERLPLRWDISEEQLLEVPGIGPKRAKELLGIMEKAREVKHE